MIENELLFFGMKYLMNVRKIIHKGFSIVMNKDSLQ